MPINTDRQTNQHILQTMNVINDSHNKIPPLINFQLPMTEPHKLKLQPMLL